MSEQRHQGSHMAKPGTEPTKAVAVVNQFRNELTAMSNQFAAVLPAHVTPEKFCRIVMTAVQQDGNLLNDRKSLLQAAMKCAQDGLLPDGREAAFVRYGGSAQYLPMIGGIMKKVRNSGEVGTLTVQLVHENDDFTYWVDHEGEHLEHKPLIFKDRGQIIGAFAMVKTKAGELYIEVMSKKDIDDVKSVSKSGNNGPWGKWYGEMAKKTVFRRLSKRLPMSTDLEDFVRQGDPDTDLNKTPASIEGQSAAERLGVAKPKVEEPVAEDPIDAEFGQVPDFQAPAEDPPTAEELAGAIEMPLPQASPGYKQDDPAPNPVGTDPFYTIPFGKFAGMDVRKVPMKDLAAYYNQVRSKKGKPETPELLQRTIEIIEAALEKGMAV